MFPLPLQIPLDEKHDFDDEALQLQNDIGEPQKHLKFCILLVRMVSILLHRCH